MTDQQEQVQRSPDYKGRSLVFPLLVAGADRSIVNLQRCLHLCFQRACITSSANRMACTSMAKKVLKPSQEDRISALPDDILQNVLGFLRADEAVHTSLLARRWRYLWKSMRRLHINFLGSSEESNEDFLNRFVNCLLLHREPSSTLDEFEFNYYDLDGDSQYIGTWIRHALSLQTQVISVRYLRTFTRFCCRFLDTPCLVSRYLRRMDISEVELRSNFLDFSRCLVLEDLRIEDCVLETTRISSQSLKHLSMKRCRHSRDDVWFHISAPILVSLQLVSFGGRIPLLERMMLLETADIKLLPKNLCGEGYAGQVCGICANCCGNNGHEGGCVVFGGLSHAKNLELLAYPGMFFFRKDLRWCPTFSKLKTLLLNEWCIQPDLRALVCMLEHSPVLENLTLQLRKQQEKEEPAPEMEENRSLMKKPAAVSGYLKIIKVNFEEMDHRVWKVLNFLSTFGIEIIIQRTDMANLGLFYC